jgi:hypothetical protein
MGRLNVESQRALAMDACRATVMASAAAVIEVDGLLSIGGSVLLVEQTRRLRRRRLYAVKVWCLAPACAWATALDADLVRLLRDDSVEVGELVAVHIRIHEARISNPRAMSLRASFPAKAAAAASRRHSSCGLEYAA